MTKIEITALFMSLKALLDADKADEVNRILTTLIEKADKE